MNIYLFILRTHTNLSIIYLYSLYDRLPYYIATSIQYLNRTESNLSDMPINEQTIFNMAREFVRKSEGERIDINDDK